MKTLYMIGNGFDLHHGLPTKYLDFRDFVGNERDVATLFEYFALADRDEDDLWRDFETSLATFDSQQLFDDYNHANPMAEDFKPSHVYGVEDELTQVAADTEDGIREKFRAWIEQIDLSDVPAKALFRPHDIFLTFNYTSTLEEVYSIDCSRVCHIHGSVVAGDQLVFGHGVERTQEPDLDEYGDSNRTPFSDAEGVSEAPFYAFQKPVAQVLRKTSSFFDFIEGFERVVVWGHSLGAVDHPYFEEVARRCPQAQWIVIVFNPKEQQVLGARLEKCGVPASKISFCSSNDLDSHPI